MSSKLIPSNPDEVMVIRDVTPNITTFSVPFYRFGSMKIGGRGTLVRMTNGELAVFSPVALTESAKAKVTSQGGNVRYIVALDYEHHIFLSEWKKQYPDAKLIGPEGLPEKRAKQADSDPKIGKEEFATVFTKAKKRETRIGEEFDRDFEYEYVDGHVNKEIAFLHKPDSTLIQADLMFNLPCKEQFSKVPEAQKPGNGGGFFARMFEGMQSPAGNAKGIKRFNWYMAAKDKPSFNESIKRIDTWDFRRMIPCHGETLETDGKEVFRKVFEWHLEGKK